MIIYKIKNYNIDEKEELQIIARCARKFVTFFLVYFLLYVDFFVLFAKKILSSVCFLCI